jgi:hypothetical protein
VGSLRPYCYDTNRYETTSPAASTAGGQFQVGNGEIVSPDRTVLAAKGINVYDSQMGDATRILADFPGINFVRLNIYSYQSPSAYAAFIQTMTSDGVVVELEDHTNSSHRHGVEASRAKQFRCRRDYAVSDLLRLGMNRTGKDRDARDGHSARSADASG